MQFCSFFPRGVHEGECFAALFLLAFFPRRCPCRASSAMLQSRCLGVWFAALSMAASSWPSRRSCCICSKLHISMSFFQLWGWKVVSSQEPLQSFRFTDGVCEVTVVKHAMPERIPHNVWVASWKWEGPCAHAVWRKWYKEFRL